MEHRDAETEELLQAAGAGHRSAIGSLLGRHRDRLRRVVSARMDRRLAGRVDVSDIVQETLLAADRKLATYLRDRPLPYMKWLIGLARDRSAWLFRLHLKAGRRSVRSEAVSAASPANASTVVHRSDPADPHAVEPPAALIAAEDRDQVAAALARLASPDRAVLVLRYVELLPFPEIARRLETTLGSVKMRHLRALDRLRRLLEHDGLNLDATR